MLVVNGCVSEEWVCQRRVGVSVVNGCVSEEWVCQWIVGVEKGRQGLLNRERAEMNSIMVSIASKCATGSRVASRRPLLIPDTPALVILQRSLGSRVTWPPPDFLCTPADAGSVCVWVGGDRDVNSVSLFAPYS